MQRIDDNRNTTWDLNIADETWVVGLDATISVNDEYAIHEKTTGSDLQIFGTVKSTGLGGVYMDNADSALTVQTMGVINVRDSDGYAVLLRVAGTDVANMGMIVSDYTGVSGVGGGTLANSGTIMADSYGVSFSSDLHLSNTGAIVGYIAVEAQAAGTVITNMVGGEIAGSETGIALYQTGPSTIVNEGAIRGGDAAISTQGRMDLTNRGLIAGDVVLSGANDRIDTRHGEVRGLLIGGQGDDIYLISDSSVRIADYGASEGDKVISSATYTLVGGLDDLRLVGKKAADGTGNVGHNELVGNKGRNVLDGLAGNDNLHGGAGKDILTGGADADLFIFNKGDGVDVITDYDDGTDTLSSDAMLTARDFNKLDIRQAGDDVVIDFGHGDRLILRDHLKADITAADFAT